MLDTIISKIIAVITAASLFFGFGAPQAAPLPTGTDLPVGIANFETSLASSILASSTSMTLTSVSVRGGTTLSGYHCFTIDGGSAQAEYVCGTVSSNNVTALERGISPADGVTQDDDLKFTHRRGASVEITDFPLLQRLKLQAAGEGTYESPLVYDASVSTSTLATNGQNIASVAYANSLSFGAVAQAGESAGGFVELATGIEAASSTASGTVARLALPTTISTSTAPSSGNYVVVTQASGDIDADFLPSTFARMRVTDYTASTTYTKPAGLKKLCIEMWGGGGAGGRGSSDASGGGGGAYADFCIPAANVGTTSTITIAAGGLGTSTADTDGTNGGNTSFATPSTTYMAFGGAGGGGGATLRTGGSGGGMFSNGTTTESGAYGTTTPYIFKGTSVALATTATIPPTYTGGAPGGSTNGSNDASNGGSSLYGGAGGAGARTNDTAALGGTSTLGGNGGAFGVSGSVPGGGGGGATSGTSGSGAKGMLRMTEYF